MSEPKFIKLTYCGLINEFGTDRTDKYHTIIVNIQYIGCFCIGTNSLYTELYLTDNMRDILMIKETPEEIMKLIQEATV